MLKLIQEARILIGDSWKDNPEYARGICELLANIYPMEDMDTQDRVVQILDIINNEMEMYPRVCSVTGRGMNEGYVIGDCEYVKDHENVLDLLRPNYASIDEAYHDDVCYWTEWTEEEEEMYDINGNLIMWE